MHGTYGGPGMKTMKTNGGSVKVSHGAGPKSQQMPTKGPGSAGKRKSGIPASRSVENKRGK